MWRTVVGGVNNEFWASTVDHNVQKYDKTNSVTRTRFACRTSSFDPNATLLFLVAQIYVYDFDDEGNPLRTPRNILPTFVLTVRVISCPLSTNFLGRWLKQGPALTLKTAPLEQLSSW